MNTDIKDFCHTTGKYELREMWCYYAKFPNGGLKEFFMCSIDCNVHFCMQFLNPKHITTWLEWTAKSSRLELWFKWAYCNKTIQKELFPHCMSLWLKT